MIREHPGADAALYSRVKRKKKGGKSDTGGDQLLQESARGLMLLLQGHTHGGLLLWLAREYSLQQRRAPVGIFNDLDDKYRGTFFFFFNTVFFSLTSFVKRTAWLTHFRGE